MCGNPVKNKKMCARFPILGQNPRYISTLRRYKEPLRQLGARKASVQRRRQVLLRQKGKGFWRGMHDLCCCVLP